LLIGLTLLLIVLLVPAQPAQPAAAVQAPTPLNPADQALDTQQLDAQDLALADPRVLDATAGNRAEVFEVFPLFGPYAAQYAPCDETSCFQVDIYDFDDNATVTAIVHVAQGKVLDVWHLPDTHPLINKRLYNRAVEIIRNDASVEAALGFRPEPVQIRLMDLNHVDTDCDGRHLCAGATFFVDSGVVWVAVDLTDDAIEKIWWSERPTDLKSAQYNPVPEAAPEDCGTTIHVARDGWNLDYRTTPTDALEVTSVTYDDGTTTHDVATRMKLVEWHAHYPGDWGYRDYTGCGGGGGGFPIYPYGDTQVLNMYDGLQYVGFEVVQDFRMGNWGYSCNYRYEQHFQFYTDGRFRTVTGAFGQGCGNDMDQEATYRPVVRLDLAVDGDPNDTLAIWDGSDWVDQATEGWWLQSDPYTGEGYRYRVTDDDGFGYYLEPGQGQFGDGGTGDRAYLYLTLHKPEEGDGDMPAWGSSYCCYGDYRQGPENFINGESVASQNLVLWYVPQSTTITTWQVLNQGYDAQYCWTDSPSETWPCWSGPMFHPIAPDVCSPYDFDCNYSIDSLDISAVAEHWNCTLDPGGETCYDPGFDLDRNDTIDVLDIMMDAGRWGCILGEACYN
jgi:hypothetical protein